MRLLPATALLLIALILATPARAEQEFIVSAGKGLNDALIQQKSIASAEMLGINWAYLLEDCPANNRRSQWWLQASYSRLWEQHHGRDQTQNILELKPVLRWYPRPEAQGFFGEAGLGAAYLSERNFGAIRIQAKWNFAMHFAAGYRLPGGSSISLRYSHFSNAYTNARNPGFDFASVNWHFSF